MEAAAEAKAFSWAVDLTAAVLVALHCSDGRRWGLILGLPMQNLVRRTVLEASSLREAIMTTMCLLNSDFRLIRSFTARVSV